ncbi:MAG: quinolinate synthase NadA [Anaerovoracaceae bacterium]|jgi:quinolinate synthase|nr:quinolinate synthase NadA [Anaerovoracaceae bacterium]
MKKITLDRVYQAIKQEKEEVILDPTMIERASQGINRMMELAKK